MTTHTELAAPMTWQKRILAAHPDSNPEYWPDALKVTHMEAEILELRAALSTERLAGGGEWCALTDEDRERAMRSMPDMLDGFLKSWGWLHFAKAIEAICREKNPTPPPQAERVPLSDEQILEVAKDPQQAPCNPWWLKDEVVLNDIRAAAISFARAIERAHGITPKEGT